MASNKRKRKKGGGGRPVQTASPEAALAELATRRAELAELDPGAAGPVWGAVHKLLVRAGADPADVTGIIAVRDLDLLDTMTAKLRGEEVEETPQEDTPAVEFSHEDLRHAMRAFKRRVKFMKLDHESKIGGNPLTSGREAEIGAIIPPQEFPVEIWPALVREGKLRDVGQGFYEATDG